MILPVHPFQPLDLSEHGMEMDLPSLDYMDLCTAAADSHGTTLVDAEVPATEAHLATRNICAHPTSTKGETVRKLSSHPPFPPLTVAQPSRANGGHALLGTTREAKSEDITCHDAELLRPVQCVSSSFCSTAKVVCDSRKSHLQS